MSVKILVGDALEMLRDLPDESVNCCVTSPPYWGLRDYGVEGQIGLEETPNEWCESLVNVFREVRRVLRSDGTLWLNLGDSYAGSWGAQKKRYVEGEISRNSVLNHPKRARNTGSIKQAGLKPKDLIGAPWMVAFALRADGWYLRRDIIWHKPNPMPESVTDRPTTAHEYVFLLTKSDRYWYDDIAIRELDSGQDHRRNILQKPEPSGGVLPEHTGIRTAAGRNGQGRNARSVWTIPTKPFPGAHFATFPPDLAERCILAGCPKGGTVLDPFGGAGTTCLVADRLQRKAIVIELNPEYATMAMKRIDTDRGALLDLMSG